VEHGVPVITGSTSVCLGSTTTLSGAPSGGSWSSSNPSVASINSSTGVVSGVSTGTTAIITYTVTSNGCSNSNTTAITVDPKPVVAAITGKQNVLVSDTIILSNITAGGVWTSTDNNIATVDAGGIVTGIASGITTVTYTVTSSGCIGTATTTITVDEIPVEPITGNKIGCVGSTTTLTSATTGGVWSISDATIATIDANTGNVSWIAAGSATVTYAKTINGNTRSVTTTVTVNAKPVAANISANSAVSFCAGDSVILTSNAATGNSWYRDNNFVSSANSLIAFTAGTYTVKITDANNCVSNSSNGIVVAVNAKPVKPVITTSNGTATFCLGSSMTLKSSNATGNKWFRNGDAIAGADADTIVVTKAGTYTVVTTNQSGCVADTSDATTLIVYTALTKPNVSLTEQTTFCYGGSVTISSSATTGNQWYKDGVIIPGATAKTYAAKESGLFTVTTSNAGCISDTSSDIKVTVKPLPAPPTITALSDTVFCNGDSVILSSSAAINNIWYKDSVAIPGANATTLKVKVGGNYFVTTTDTAGCTSYFSDTAIIIVHAIPPAPTVSPVAYCKDATPTALTAAGQSILWYANASGGTGSSLAPTPLTTIVGSTNYFVSQSIFGCESPRATLPVTINAYPSSNAGIDFETDKDTVNLAATISANQTGTWSAVFGNPIIVNPNDPLTTISQLQEGPNPMVWTITQNNCITTDTVMVFKLVARIDVTLNAQKPIKQADESFFVDYIVKVTNTGNTDLNNIQLTVDLTKVYPFPVEFQVISAPKPISGTINPNGGFSGTGNNSLLSFKKNKIKNGQGGDETGTLLLTIDGQTTNSGNNNTAAEADEDKDLAGFFQGFKLLGTNSILNIADSALLVFTVRIAPNGNYGPYEMNVEGDGDNDYGTHVKDTSTDANLVKTALVTGINYPTIVSLIPNPQIAASMETVSVVKIADNSYDVTMRGKIKNAGNLNLNNIQSYLDMKKQVKAPLTFSVKSLTSLEDSGLIINPLFDGVNDTSMLSDRSGLTVGATGYFELVFNVHPNGGYGNHTLQINVKGTTTEYNIVKNNTSFEGAEPDSSLVDTLNNRPTVYGFTAPPSVAPPAPVITITAYKLCEGSTTTLAPYTLAAQGLIVYEWYNSPLYPNATNKVADITKVGKGIYYLFALDTKTGLYSDPSAAFTITEFAKQTTPVVSANGSTTICDGDEIILTSTVADNYQWFKNDVLIAGSNAQTLKVTAGGAFTIKVTDVNGCVSEASAVTTVTVNVKPAQPSIIASGDTTFCEGGSVTLTASNSSSYQWFKDGIAIAGATSASIIANTAGLYSIATNPVSGCTSPGVASMKVSISPKATAVDITVAGQSSVCADNTATLSASSSTVTNPVYRWYADANLNTLLGTGAVYKTTPLTAATSVYVTVTGTGMCENAPSDAKIFTVNIAPKPAAPSITLSGPASMLAGSSVTITASAADNYEWYKDGVLVPVFNPTGNPGNTIKVTAPGIYTVKGTVNGCISQISSSVVITIIDPAALMQLEKIAGKAVWQLDGSYHVPFTIRAHNMKPEPMFDVQVQDDLTKVFPSQVQYSIVSIRSTGKLKANALYDGKVNIDLLTAGSDLDGSTTDSIQFVVKVAPNNFTGDLLNSATLTATTQYGKLSIKSYDPFTGTTVIAPTKFLIPKTELKIPDGFSPNKDGLNDVFFIKHSSDITINLQIYNRWGNIVYNMKDYQNNWDGKSNQPGLLYKAELPDGTYFYLVEVKDKTTGKSEVFKSSLTLKR
jgi:gliding motility-associated-like protein